MGTESATERATQNITTTDGIIVTNVNKAIRPIIRRLKIPGPNRLGCVDGRKGMAPTVMPRQCGAAR